MFLGESPSGTGLEGALESNCLARIGECNGGLDTPWLVLRGVRDFPGIMLGQASLKIIGEADVKMAGVQKRFQNVNVGKLRHGSAFRLR